MNHQGQGHPNMNHQAHAPVVGNGNFKDVASQCSTTMKRGFQNDSKPKVFKTIVWIIGLGFMTYAIVAHNGNFGAAANALKVMAGA